jgi:hypothetical protein
VSRRWRECWVDCSLRVNLSITRGSTLPPHVRTCPLSLLAVCGANIQQPCPRWTADCSSEIRGSAVVDGRAIIFQHKNYILLTLFYWLYFIALPSGSRKGAKCDSSLRFSWKNALPWRLFAIYFHDAIPRRPWLLQAGCTKNVLDQVHVMSLHWLSSNKQHVTLFQHATCDVGST